MMFMKQKVFLFVALVSAIIHTTMSQSADVVSANTQFANKLFQEIAGSSDGNIFFSPISVHTILTLLYQGAEGSTQQALATALNLPQQKAAAESYKDVMATLNAVTNVTLKIANKVWVKEGLTLNKNFNALAVNNFYAEAEQANFNQPEESAKIINNWVEEETNNKIKDLITPDMIDDLTAMILVNAIYFKGNWLRQFKKEQTVKEKFYVSDSETIDVDMMHNEAQYGYAENSELDAKILEMPYANEDVSMLVILPNQKTGIKALQQKLANVDLSTLGRQVRKVKVQVSLPKFKIETKIDLKDILSKLGLEVIFSDSANFGGLLEDPQDLKVSKAIQKAFIEVNEEGAEAAAATGFGIVLLSAPIRGLTFEADHPFLIILKRKNNILFLGQIARPHA